MASEQDRVTLPPELEEWLSSRADETDHSEAALLARAVAAYRLLETLPEDPDSLDAELTALDALEDGDTERLDALESTVDERFEELKSRIIDVLKETRNRAPAEHDHPALDERIERLSSELSGLSAAHDTLKDDHNALASAHEDLETRVAADHEAIDDRLGELVDAFETLETRSDRLAGAVVDLRRRLSRIEQVTADRQSLDTLLETAHEEGLSKATCESCNSGIELSLLRAPWCPHCSARFESIEPRSFFRRPLLTVADRPALEAGESSPEHRDIAPPATEAHSADGTGQSTDADVNTTDGDSQSTDGDAKPTSDADGDDDTHSEGPKDE